MKRTISIGLMSGTSLDGVDAVAVDFDEDRARFLGHAYLPFEPDLAQELASLCLPGDNEIDRMGRAALRLTERYAQTVESVLAQVGVDKSRVLAVGVHGQTIRHRPQWGWTLQLNNPADLAERLGLDVVADFRSRDMAAGGQGAPLVPAFHQCVFQSPTISRTIVNIGGIANLTYLPAQNRPVIGFDCGPGNTLMDAWNLKHRSTPYDNDGAWGARGQVDFDLLNRLLSDPFFSAPYPKSTGREYFNLEWLDRFAPCTAPENVQASLRELTAISIARAIQNDAPDTREVFVCGGGAFNRRLMQSLREALGGGATVSTTEALGIHPMHVEAMAFAWLARQFCLRRFGNLPDVTNARGKRILGALYPA